MCFYGNCRSHTCENCKPKMVVCPHCGGKTLLLMNQCIYCKQTVPDEAKQDAVAAWYARQAELRQREAKSK
ncbi:hypothetical protein LPY66_09245 [Dehalobacter sp. DCM]|uniref:hypothetical protein n=1 Tax=Dehalobacter sp. DCM TaxID=2907827 RepID=UPI003081A593|nr:hypothetical protein LPY66_09245 [Dehalobacter sp. DCM]